MAVYGISPYSEADKPQLIGVKTNIGGYFFDAVLKVDHNSSLKITSHPIETGGNISDHAYMEPQSISMEIGMSDACVSYIDGQFEQRYTRPVSAYDTLKQLQRDRVKVDVLTRLELYKNMMIENITVSDDYTSLFGLRATVMLTEIIMAKTKTVIIENVASKSPQITGSTNKGTVQPQKNSQSDNTGGNKSILQSLSEMVGG